MLWAFQSAFVNEIISISILIFDISGMCLLGFCLLIVDNNNIPAGTSIKRSG